MNLQPINPYIAGSPVTGTEMFYGREDVFSFIKRNLIGQHRDTPIVLYGQRRTGKTSVLYQLHRHLNPSYRCIFIDLHGLNLNGVGNLLLGIANSIERGLRRDHHLAVDVPDRAVFLADPRSAFESVFLESVWSTLGEDHLVLMVDEVIRLDEEVRAGRLERDIFDYFRHLMQHHTRLNFIFSLGSGLEEMAKEYAFLFSVSLYHRISLLEPAAARKLITQPARDYYEVEPQAVDKILQITSGHPYYTQLACHCLFDLWWRSPKSVMDAADVDTVLAEAIELGSPNLTYVWEDSTPGEQALMVGVAAAMRRETGQVTLDQVRDTWCMVGVSPPDREFARALRSLLGREVLFGGQSYSFTVDLQRLWLEKHRRLESVKEELAEALRQSDRDADEPEFASGHATTDYQRAEGIPDLIGLSAFSAEDEPGQSVDDREISFSAQDLVVKSVGGKILLNHITFPIPEKSLVGVIGPSGAGKSTLLAALSGMRPADTGTVLYDNRDLYRNYAEFRYRIGLVPQETALHAQLTARRALQYSAELRFPADISAHERDARVDEVMDELGLTRHANTRADRLSGGQLKRVNVAQELLTKPSLLFLDEPTSGLNPLLQKSVMEQMRDLAHDGRTVIVVTDNINNLDLCDRLLVLAPGGKVAYYGLPAEGLSYFGKTRWEEVFLDFERYPDRDWAAEYATSRAHARYVLGQRPRPTPTSWEQQLPEPKPRQRGVLGQLSTLIRRYLRVIAADRAYLLFIVLLPVILGVLIFYVGNSQGLKGPPGPKANGSTVLLVLVLCACLSGAALSVRELVKERTIYIRERAAGLSSGAYLSSKLVVLGVISLLQSFVLILLGVATHELPLTGSFLTQMPLDELVLGVAALTVTSMCLGLLVSALVSTSENAISFLVLLTMVQVILSGAIPVSVPFALTAVSPASWGFGAVASTADLNNTDPITGNSPDTLWDHTASQWLTDMAVTIGLGLLFALLAWIRLRRLNPGRRR